MGIIKPSPSELGLSVAGNPLWFLRCSDRIYCGLPAACHLQVCQGAETRENCVAEKTEQMF